MTDLHRCADCQHDPGTGWHCATGNRPERGRTRLRCERFERVQPASLRVPGHAYVVALVPGRLGPTREFVRPRPQ